MHPAWVRSIRDQCNAAGTAFFFKQWGEWEGVGDDEIRAGASDVFFWPWLDERSPGPRSYRVGKKAAGALLDGREWREMPE